MGGRSRARPAAPPPQQVTPAVQPRPSVVAAPSNANLEANAELRAALEKEEKTNRAIFGSESVADVQAREQQTLKSPRKARARGRRSLISGELGLGSIGRKESLG